MATDLELAAAQRAFAKTRRDNAPVLAARFDAERRLIVLKLATGVELSFPPALLRGFEAAGAEDLAEAEINAGTHVHFMPLDEGFYVPDLMTQLVGRNWLAVDMGKAGGKAQSPVKAAAARANGARGGRPRKPVV
ncbi:MAG: DUF2442 domain-containing protein [Zavarzinia sp.]|nr:DUF2442 domain-containing protein [Zavarzinia sp.]